MQSYFLKKFLRSFIFSAMLRRYARFGDFKKVTEIFEIHMVQLSHVAYNHHHGRAGNNVNCDYTMGIQQSNQHFNCRYVFRKLPIKSLNLSQRPKITSIDLWIKMHSLCSGFTFIGHSITFIDALNFLIEIILIE